LSPENIFIENAVEDLAWTKDFVNLFDDAQVRYIEKITPGIIKKASSSELKNKLIARKSIVASRFIRKGELFKENNIAAKRPGTGISPMRWNEVLGSVALKDFYPDDLIEL
jgi:N,N'-diacetyllegionaminate synthase